jgi:predicted Fe-Mo cluster-binding NifX family protein
MSEERRSFRIAVASDGDQGLNSPVSAHFGRCPTYTLVDVRSGTIYSHQVVANPHHERHAPGEVPCFLAGLEAEVVLAGGMGPRAVAMFQGLGIQVATGVSGTVHDALRGWLGGARGITPCRHDHPDSCGGHRH